MVTLLGLLAAWHLEPEASAEPPSWLLEWSAPDGCASEQELRDSVTQLLGAPVEELLHDPLVVRGSIEPSSEGYRISLVSAGPRAQGERVVEAASCAEALRIAALLVALAVEPRLRDESTVAGSGPASAAFPSTVTQETTAADQTIATSNGANLNGANPAPTTTAPPSTTASRSVAASKPARAELRPPRTEISKEDDALPWRTSTPLPITGAGLELVARLSVGDLPHAAGGVGLGGTLEFGRESLALSLGGYARQAETIHGSGAGRAEFWGSDLSLTFCHDLLGGSARFGPCLGGRAVLVRGDGQGLSENAGTNALILGPVVGASASLLAIGSLRAVANAHLHWRPARPRFVIDGDTEVYRPNTLAGVFGLGAALNFR